MDGNICDLRHNASFDEQLENLGNIKDVDAALNILTYAIARNAKQFPFVPGFDKIQLAKSEPYERGGISVPPLRVWFRQLNDDLIELLGIETYEK